MIKNVLAKVVLYSFLVGLCGIMIMPFVWIVSLSFRDTYSPSVVFSHFFPRNPTLNNYIKGFVDEKFLIWFLNSVFVTGVATVFCLFFDTLAGYAFAKLEMPGKEILFIFLLASLMIPFSILMIPLFVTFKFLGLINTRIAMAIPPFAYIFGVFLMREYIKPIPRDLLDSARIDGCGDWGVFFRIILPICKPALATLSVFTFILTWNSFVWPLVIISDVAKMPITIGMATFSTRLRAWGMISTLAVVGTLPPVVFFLALQKYYIKAIVLSGMKG